jgi:hypothetical protein
MGEASKSVKPLEKKFHFQKQKGLRCPPDPSLNDKPPHLCHSEFPLLNVHSLILFTCSRCDVVRVIRGVYLSIRWLNLGRTVFFMG